MDLRSLSAHATEVYRGCEIKRGLYAVVRKFEEPPQAAGWMMEENEEGVEVQTKTSELIEWVELEEGFFILDCESIYDLACVVPNIPIIPWAESRARKIETKGDTETQARVGETGGYFVVGARKDWETWFTSLVLDGWGK
jgi:hypothetical protein